MILIIFLKLKKIVIFENFYFLKELPKKEKNSEKTIVILNYLCTSIIF
jgi:hypothetical protein